MDGCESWIINSWNIQEGPEGAGTFLGMTIMYYIEQKAVLPFWSSVLPGDIVTLAITSGFISSAVHMTPSWPPIGVDALYFTLWGQWTPAQAESVSGTLIREGGTQFYKEPPSEMRHGRELASEQAGSEGKNSQTPQGFPGAQCGRKARSLTLLPTWIPAGPCPPSWAPSCTIKLRV